VEVEDGLEFLPEHRAHIWCYDLHNLDRSWELTNITNANLMNFFELLLLILECCSIEDGWQAMTAAGLGIYHHPGLQTRPHSAISLNPNRLHALQLKP
jgi:hypothetical protein